LPAAPPTTSATPTRASRWISGSETANITSPTRAATDTRASSPVLNGRSTPSSSPNAAPVLWMRVRLNRFGITAVVS
jgi:hypothetical protein